MKHDRKSIIKLQADAIIGKYIKKKSVGKTKFREDMKLLLKVKEPIHNA